MNKNVFIPVLFVFIVMLSGCQKTPEQVRDNAKKYQKNAVEQTVAIEKSSILDIIKECQTIQVETNNLKLPERINIEENVLYNLSGAYDSNFFDENKDEMLSLFGLQENTWDEYIEDEVKYHSMDCDGYFVIADNGFICYYNQACNDLIDEIADLGVQKVVDIYAGETDVSVEPQVNYANTWLQDHWNFEKNIEYKIGKVLIYNVGGKQVLQMTAYAYYNGVLVDNVCFCTENTEENKKGYSLPETTILQLDLYMLHDDAIDGISNGIGMVQLDTRAEYTEGVTLNSAIHLVEQKLSGFQKIEIVQLRLHYKLIVEYTEEEKRKKDEKHDIPFCETNRKITAKPVYSFLIKKVKEDENDYADSNIYNYVDIDLLTGNITTVLDGI